MRIYGPQEHDAYEKAAALVRQGKPSQLAKRLAALLCNCRPKPLQNGCCAIARGMWRAQLPKEVCAAIAGKSIEGDNFDTVIQIADDVFKALKGPLAATTTTTPAVAATTKESKETETSAAEVAAFNRGRGYQGRGRGATRQYRGSRGYRQTRGAARVHPDGAPTNACSQHKQYGKQAFFCREPLSCPWVSYVTGKSQNPTTTS